MDVEIRELRDLDRDCVRALADRLTVGVAPWRDHTSVLMAVRGWTHESTDGAFDGQVLVAERDGEVVGFVSLSTHRPLRRRDRCVHRGADGRRGLRGRRDRGALVSAAERLAAEDGHRCLTLTTGAANGRRSPSTNAKASSPKTSNSPRSSVDSQHSDDDDPSRPRDLRRTAQTRCRDRGHIDDDHARNRRGLRHRRFAQRVIDELNALRADRKARHDDPAASASGFSSQIQCHLGLTYQPVRMTSSDAGMRARILSATAQNAAASGWPLPRLPAADT